MLGNSVAAVVIVRTRPRAIPLAMITMRTSSHGFPFLSRLSMGLRLARRSSAIISTIYRLKHFTEAISVNVINKLQSHYFFNDLR